MSVSAGWTEEQVWAADPSPASGPAPRGAGSAPARPGAKPGTSKRQPVLPVGLHDGALPASLGNGQLRGALGTLGLIHDLLAELVLTSLLAEARQSLGHMLRFHLLASGGGLGWRQAGGGKAQRVRVQLEQSRFRWCGVAKLEAQLDGGRQMSRRACEQQVGIADRVQRRGASKSAAN